MVTPEVGNFNRQESGVGYMKLELKTIKIGTIPGITTISTATGCAIFCALFVEQEINFGVSFW